MTEELQDDTTIADNLDQVEVNEESSTDESGAELAPAAGENQTKNNDGAQKAINKQHAKFREQERRANELDKKLADANSKIEKFNAEKQDVTIPEMPESYDEDYKEKVAARDTAIRQSAINEATKQQAVIAQNAAEEAAKTADNERVQKMVEYYDNQITALGLNADDIRRAGKVVIDYGLSTELAEHILLQVDGPLITKYLETNPIILDELKYLTPIQGADRINTDIRQAASTLKPQASNAPDPADILTGLGAGEVRSGWLKGAKIT